jgi:hypothetical protein
MPETEEFQTKKLFTERIYKQLQTVEEYRFKFSTMKIAFVTGLLGIGSMKLTIHGNTVTLYLALLLAPFVAVLFDILGMAATVGIYRIDAFLRTNGDPSEKEWQGFLKKHSSSFYLWAANGFTLITFVASIVLYILQPEPPNIHVCWLIWGATLIVILWILFRCWEWEVKRRLRDLEEEVPRSDR